MYITAKEWNLENIIDEINKLERAYDRAEDRRLEAIENEDRAKAEYYRAHANNVATRQSGIMFVLTELGFEVKWDEENDREPAKELKQTHTGAIYGTLDWCDMVHDLMHILHESDDNERKKKWLKKVRDKGIISNDEAIDLYTYFES